MDAFPQPLTAAQMLARRRRVTRIARSLGFVGHVEYRHLYSQTGGAQYGRGVRVGGDLLTVYAEAFDRDAKPADFSLEAMIAHERGHQLVARHARIAPRMAGRISAASEEILASLLGAMICPSDTDRDALVSKAIAELLDHGESLDRAIEQIDSLWNLMESLL